VLSLPAPEPVARSCREGFWRPGWGRTTSSLILKPSCPPFGPTRDAIPKRRKVPIDGRKRAPMMRVQYTNTHGRSAGLSGHYVHQLVLATLRTVHCGDVHFRQRTGARAGCCFGDLKVQGPTRPSARRVSGVFGRRLKYLHCQGCQTPEFCLYGSTNMTRAPLAGVEELEEDGNVILAWAPSARVTAAEGFRCVSIHPVRR
jgi:hypothetical protein